MFAYQPGQVILKRGNGILSWAISKTTDSPYTHTVYPINEEEAMEAQALGVCITKISDLDYSYDVYQFDQEFTQQEKIQYEKIGRFMKGMPYDYFQLPYYLIMAVFGGENKFNRVGYVVCSEVGIRMFDFIGHDPIPGTRDIDATPASWNNEYFNLVYEHRVPERFRIFK